MYLAKNLVRVVIGLGLAIAPNASYAGFGCGVGSSYLSTWGAYGMGGGFRAGSVSNCFTPSYSFCHTRPVCRVSWGACRSYSSFASGGFSCFQPAFYAGYRGWGCVTPVCYPSATCYSGFFAAPSFSRSFVTRSWGCAPGWLPAMSYSSWCASGYIPTYSSLYHRGFARSGLVPNGFVPNFGQPRLNVEVGVSNASRLVATPAKPLNLPVPVATKVVQSKPAGQDEAGEASWLVLAAELVDSMAQQGGVHEGLASVEQLIRVRQNLSSDIYWRAAIFASLAGRNSKQVAQYIELAKQSGTAFNPRQLPGGSLRGYVQRIPGQSFDQALNRHAQTALTDSEPADAYRVLASFLEHDGQSLRAEKFALAAQRSSSTAKQLQLDTSAPKVVLGMRP